MPLPQQNPAEHESLYPTLGVEPAFAESAMGGGPGTIETSAIETIDNDRATLLLPWSILGD
jgi:hypothetical protein